MKRLPALLVISIYLAISVFNVKAQNMYIGARVGENLANQSQEHLESGFSNSEHMGFLAGAELDFWFDRVWSLSAQLLYDQKGTNQSYALGTDDLLYNYLEIPILLKASIGFGSFSPYVFAGPSVGFFLSGNEHAKGQFTFQNSPSLQTVDTTIAIDRSSINSPDIAAVFGFGASFKIPSGTMLFLEAAYAIGFVNIENTDYETVIKSRDIRLAAGILFPLD